MAEGKDGWVWESRRPAHETRPDFLHHQEPEEAADRVPCVSSGGWSHSCLLPGFQRETTVDYLCEML